MRRANHNNWLHNEKKELVGIDLGSDFTAEHEWGIKEIKQSFGISDDVSVFGIGRRRITNVPATIYFKRTKTKAVLIFDRYRFSIENLKASRNPKLPMELGVFRDQTLGTAWDGGSFGIITTNKEGMNNLEALHLAIENKEIGIWLGGGGVFQNAGLVIAIVDRCPQDQLKIMYDADEEAYKVKLAADKSGIVAELKKADKLYFALSPKFDGNKQLTFWLNPMEQQQNNCGWYNLEQLRQWIDNKGPIPTKTGVIK